ncbi:helix-turn-helix domain-containing protein [Lonepinella sp. BR2919]|uniref:helix-turn-helix domain-containing protein n=1 Tax=unclassified Lonepinella TaxID=2642006 RepID=UPI003F6E4373
MKASEKIRENIRRVRKEKGLTQATVAEMLGMSETGYAKIERGETGGDLGFDRLARIANVLDVDMFDLLPQDAGIVFNNSNDNFSNSSHFSLALGDMALEAEIRALNQVIAGKNELLDGRDREIEILKQQITTLQDLVETLKSK